MAKHKNKSVSFLLVLVPFPYLGCLVHSCDSRALGNLRAAMWGMRWGNSETGGWRHKQGQNSVNLEMELGFVLRVVGAIEGF